MSTSVSGSSAARASSPFREIDCPDAEELSEQRASAAEAAQERKVAALVDELVVSVLKAREPITSQQVLKDLIRGARDLRAAVVSRALADGRIRKTPGHHGAYVVVSAADGGNCDASATDRADRSDRSADRSGTDRSSGPPPYRADLRNRTDRDDSSEGSGADRSTNGPGLQNEPDDTRQRRAEGARGRARCVTARW